MVDNKDLLSESLAKMNTMNIVEFMNLLVECGVKKEDLVYKHTVKNEQLHDNASKWVEDIISYLSPLIDEPVNDPKDMSKRLGINDELYKHSGRPDDIAAKLADLIAIKVWEYEHKDKLSYEEALRMNKVYCVYTNQG